MSEETKSAEAEKPLSTSDKLRALLSDFSNAPSSDDIEKMKAKHGDVFVSALSDDEIFIFRALTRKEHRDLNTKIAEGKLPAENFDDEVVGTCLLWKSVKDLDSKGGTVPSLLEQIMQNSNFLPPQLLSQLVTKL
jgi:hypothetical protein